MTNEELERQIQQIRNDGNDEFADAVAALCDWKESAAALLYQWDEVWDALGRPGELGTSKVEGSLKAVVSLLAFRAEVPAALDALETALRPDLFLTPEFYQAAMQIVEITREQLGLAPGKDESNGLPN